MMKSSEKLIRKEQSLFSDKNSNIEEIFTWKMYSKKVQKIVIIYFESFDILALWKAANECAFALKLSDA